MALTETSFRLRGKIANGTEELFDLHPGENLIGRWDPDGKSFPEIDLESLDLDAKVSRKHALLTVRANEFILEDAGSLNGTFLRDGASVKAGDKITLKAGDEFIVGTIRLMIEAK